MILLLEVVGGVVVWTVLYGAVAAFLGGAGKKLDL